MALAIPRLRHATGDWKVMQCATGYAYDDLPQTPLAAQFLASEEFE